MCYITKASKSALGVFVMLDKAGISALGGKRVKLCLAKVAGPSLLYMTVGLRVHG